MAEASVSSSKLKLVEHALAIADQEAVESGDLGFLARALVMATLPHSDPKTDRFERKNGDYTLTITALQDGLGIPYGSLPRLVMAWICTEATRTQSRDLVLGDSLSDWMRQLGLSPTGGRNGSITRLRDQMHRLFGCAFSIGYADSEGAAGINTLVASRYSLWWNDKQPGQRSLFPSTLYLSEDFYREITEHPVPLDMRALRMLKRSPLALDIYAWLNWRLFRVKKPVCIPWESLQTQFGAGYPLDTARGKADFKRKFKDAMRKVSLVLPEARVGEASSGLLLKPGKPAIRSAK